MVYLDERKLRETLYKVAPYLYIPLEELDEYVNEIMKRAKERPPIVIDPYRRCRIEVISADKKHVETVAEFRNGCMYVGEWVSGLSADLYIVGRGGYVEYGLRPRLREYQEGHPIYVSRIQLIVTPREDGKVEIRNVGLNEIRVVEEEKNESRYTKPLDRYTRPLAILLFMLGGFSALLTLSNISRTPLFTGATNLTFALILFFIALALLLLFRRVSKTTYPRHKS